MEVLHHLKRDEHPGARGAAHALGVLVSDRDDAQLLFTLKDRKHTDGTAITDRRCGLGGSWRQRRGCRSRALGVEQSQFLSN